MRRLFGALALAALVAALQPAIAKTLMIGGGPPQYPADPNMIISQGQILARIAEADAAARAGHKTSGVPLVMQGPFRATMEWRNTAQDGIHVHETDAELFVVVQGSGAMTLGGKLVNPQRARGFSWEGPTLTSKQVTGAKIYPIAKGDVILIPPGTPHTVSAVHRKLVLWSMHLPMPTDWKPDAEHGVAPHADGTPASGMTMEATGGRAAR